MYHLVLLFAAALLCTGCRSASVSKHIKLFPDFENSIESDVLPPKHAVVRHFLALSRKPFAAYEHSSGTVLSINCEALGAPAPTIRWFKNDAPVYEHDSESNELLDSNPSSLARITSTLLVSRTSGRDVYTCLASSGNNVKRANTIVFTNEKNTDITDRTKLLPLKPMIIVSYKAFVDTIGNNVVLPCKAKGHPRPHITWRDNNGTLIKNDDRMKVLRSGELVISSLRWSDMGEFVCQASNAFGSQLTSTFLYPALAG